MTQLQLVNRQIEAHRTQLRHQPMVIATTMDRHPTSEAQGVLLAVITSMPLWLGVAWWLA